MRRKLVNGFTIDEILDRVGARTVNDIMHEWRYCTLDKILDDLNYMYPDEENLPLARAIGDLVWGLVKGV